MHAMRRRHTRRHIVFDSRTHEAHATVHTRRPPRRWHPPHLGGLCIVHALTTTTRECARRRHIVNAIHAHSDNKGTHVCAQADHTCIDSTPHARTHTTTTRTYVHGETMTTCATHTHKLRRRRGRRRMQGEMKHGGVHCAC